VDPEGEQSLRSADIVCDSEVGIAVRPIRVVTCQFCVAR
jgi:hypothetical protein